MLARRSSSRLLVACTAALCVAFGGVSGSSSALSDPAMCIDAGCFPPEDDGGGGGVPSVSVSLTAPAAGATVSGTTTVSAYASGASYVEFYVDNVLIAGDGTYPYSVSWNTLMASYPAYDNDSHSLTARAYGASTMATSAARSVTLANTSGTKYKGSLSSTGVPLEMTASNNGSLTFPIDVLLVNSSGQTWRASEVTLRYRWFTPDTPSTVIEGGTITSLGTDLTSNTTGRTVRVNVVSPSLPDGVERALYRLRVDLYDSVAARWFEAKGNRPLENPIIVNRDLVDALGLERFYHYDGEEVGAGMSHLVNLANGNSLLRWTPWSAPGRGLSTVLDLTYNSLEKKSESPVGNNFSLSISSLTRFGLPLDVHPNKADTIAGRSNRWIVFTDGDGTPHRFEGRLGTPPPPPECDPEVEICDEEPPCHDPRFCLPPPPCDYACTESTTASTTSDPQVYWEEPAGVHLYLRSITTDTNAPRYWAITRPDRVTFYYDYEGYPTAVVDGNGNTLTFTLEQVPPAGDPGGPKKRITRVTDAGGRAFTIDYFSKDEVKKPQIRGKIQSIADHSGHLLTFSYYQDGNLREIVEIGGTKADGVTPLPARAFTFSYTTPDGSGPAITDAFSRTDPDPNTNQSTRLFGVVDPLRRETTFVYYGPGSAQLRWRLASRTDRAGKTTSYSYDLAALTTTLTDPLGLQSTYAFDTDGKVTRITNPLQQVTSVQWTDRHVVKVTEPTGEFTEFEYNDNGYLTDTWDQLRNRTALEYENLPADASDVSGLWKAGRTIPHISQLVRKTSPRGTATESPTNDFQWKFTHDPNGNVLTVTDPENFVTTHTYNADGTRSTTKDANGHWTTFVAYDLNGLPAEIRESKDQVPNQDSRTTRFGYDVNGLLLWLQDARHATDQGADMRSYRTYFDYDSFHRLGRQSTPKSTQHQRGTLIWTSADYDANDNTIAVHQPAYGTAALPGVGATTASSYDVMDRIAQETGPDTSADPLGERTQYRYDAGGRLIEVTLPKGVQSSTIANDFTVFYTYDGLDRPVRETRHDVNAAGAITKTRNSHRCYDLAGDLTSITAPNAGLASVTCPTSASHTTRLAYDKAHRLLSQVDPANETQSVTYDADGNIVTQTNENGDTTTMSYDQRDLLFKTVVPFVRGGRTITSKTEYDPVGNVRRSINPRAWDAGSADKTTFVDFVTTYHYDEFNEVVRVDLPTKDAAPGPFHVHNAYDAGGNLTTTTLPSVATDIDDVRDSRKTVVTYWDPAWVKSTTNGVLPEAHYDYTAQGWQASRTPEDPAGNQDVAHKASWEYYADGQLKKRTDRGNQSATYLYDANDNIEIANETAGIVPGSNQQPYEARMGYDGFDQMTKSRHRRQGVTNYTFTSQAYDLNGNVVSSEEDGEETPEGVLVKAGRKSTFTYDHRDLVTSRLDEGDTVNTSDDRLSSHTYFPTGWQRNETLAKRAGAAWTTEQITAWTYFATGDLETQELRNGAGTVLEHHTVGYEDDAGIYVNGNRTRDVFFVRGPETQPVCRTSSCTTKYAYDALDRPTEERRERDDGTHVSRWQLDAVGNETRQWLDEVLLRVLEYTDERDQLTRIDDKVRPEESERFIYDFDGNLDCVAGDAWTASTCPAPGNSTLREDYGYDYLFRTESYKRYDGAPTPGATATYTYDPLDRLANETETHGGTSRNTSFTYVGLSDQLRSETTGSTTRSYDYNAFDRLIGLNTSGQRLTYGRNLHDDISLLVDSTDPAKAKDAYGYTPYGAEDQQLTSDKTKNPDGTLNPDIRNAFRFNATRFDTGSGNLDMGFRRFSPDTGRFTQSDLYHDALNDLDLSTDALTQNRYAFAGGNPIGFVEVDGHRVDPGTRRPPGKDWCTVVFDTGRVGDRLLFDFRDPCSAHDKCYGKWDTYRRDCDAKFAWGTQASCGELHPRRWTWRVWQIARDDAYRTACRGIAAAYAAGVAAFGHVFSWMDKAYRDDRRSPRRARGCPFPGSSESTLRRARCVYEVRSRSYLKTVSRQDALYFAEKLRSYVRGVIRALSALNWRNLIPDWRRFLPIPPIPRPRIGG